MKIISFLNSKGGVGKTTLCVNLARYLQMYQCTNGVIETCKKVLLVDSDPQGSIRDWQSAKYNLSIEEVIAADTPASLKNISRVLSGTDYDFVLIDTAGKATDMMTTAIAISDVVIIPVQPSPYDLWASNDVVELIKMRQELCADKPQAFYVLNRCIPNTIISREVSEHLDKCTFEQLGKGVNQRVVYAQTAAQGQTVFESDNDCARSDIMSIGNDLMRKMNNGI